MPKQPELVMVAASDAVGRRVRELRRRREQSVEQFVEAAADAGHPELTRDVLWAIESGRRVDGRRRRLVSVDELLALAEVLDVPAGELLLEARPATPLAGFSGERRANLEMQAARAAPALAAEITGRLTDGRAIARWAAAEAFYRLREALNVLLIGEGHGSSGTSPELSLPMEPLRRGES